MGFIADNRNKFLAIFAAGLMVAFTLPSTFRNNSGGGGADPVRATLDGQKVHVSDWKSSHDEYEYLMNVRLKRNPDRTLGQAFGPVILSQMQQHQDLYFLLVKETQRLGIRVPQDKLESILHNDIDLPPNFTLDDETTLRQAVAHFIAIRMAFERAQTAIKISEPLRQHWMAERYQAIKVKIAEFDASEFKQLVAAPTTQQVQDQFTTYGNKEPQSADPKNRFGFGYRLPNRVKFQWIELRRADILGAAKATHSDYDWDVAAQKYYRTNPQEFPTTAPASQPVVGVNPGLKPFAEVHQEILGKLQNAQADHLESAILAKLNSLMNADYAEYKKDPANAPASPLGARYGDYAYLEKVAAEIQSEFKILPAVVSMGDYKTQKQIAETAIGKATINSVDAATYLTSQIEPLATPDQKSRSLKLFQPSPSIRDDAGNIYIARATEAQEARMPSSLTDITPDINNDLRIAAGFTMARDAAVKLAVASQKSGLDKAAALAQRKVISAGPMNGARMEIPGYPLPPDSAMQLLRASSSLLKTDAQTMPHPLAVVDLPRVGKVDVIELEEVFPGFDLKNPTMMAEMSPALDEEIAQNYGAAFLEKWFQYDQIAGRMNYKIEDTAFKLQKTPSPDAQPPAQQSPF